MIGAPNVGGDPNIGAVTGGAANADGGGGAANVVGGGAESGCVALGNCTRCALASSASMVTSAAAMNRRNDFNGSTVSGAREKTGIPTSAQHGRGAGN